MDLELSNKIVLVGGSSRGIGLAAARSFLAEGARTVITGRDPESLAQAHDALVSEFGSDHLMSCQADLCSTVEIEATLRQIRQQWGSVDCLVANVGGGRGTTGWNVPESEWERLIEHNLSCAYRLAQQVIPDMTRTGKGSIVMVASIVGVESVVAPMPYSAAKAALVNYSKNLARELGPFNVRVNSVAPGNILFSGGSWDRHLSERRDEVLRQIEAEVPLRRFGSPEQVADVIVFLSSQRAAFVTGSCVVIDGGQTRGV